MVAAPWTFVAAQPAIEAPAIRADLTVATQDRAQQLAATARQTLNLLTDWLGPYPAASLTLVDANWRSPAVVLPPGTAALPVRWVEIDRDPAAERRLVAALASHYWHEALAAPADQRWFAEALVRYLGARAIDAILEGRQYWSARYFGGFIPFATRALPLSPFGADARGHIASFDSDIALPAGSDWQQVARATGALFTLERVIGWPALQQGLIVFREQAPRRGYAPAELEAVLAVQRGSDLDWFFDQAFRPEKQFDYGIQSVTSQADGASFHVRVDLQRLGDAVFGVGDGSSGPALPVRVEFADGAEVVERWPGARESMSLEYRARTAAVRVDVDPEAMLLLDQNRANNVERLTAAPVTSVSLRATLAWLTWVEDLMLTCLALI